MRRFVFPGLLSLSAVVLPAAVSGQVQEPAAPATQPSTQPSLPPLPPADTSGLAPTSVPSVKAGFEHPQAWQKAMQAVMDKIDVPELRQQLSEGMSNLAPTIARGLIDRPGDTAYTTVAVFRDAAGKQAAVVLAFEGFGTRLDATFYGRVLANLPRLPAAPNNGTPNNGAPPDLTLDPSASCYLCFFLANDGLAATAIPHETFKQELAGAFLQQGKTPLPAVDEIAVRPWLDQHNGQDVILQQQAQLADEQVRATYPTAANDTFAAEAYPPYYYGDWGLYGLGWYNPIVIVVGHHHHDHDGDWHHWKDWDWHGYHMNPKPQSTGASTGAASPPRPTNVNAAPAPRPEPPVSPYQAPGQFFRNPSPRYYVPQSNVGVIQAPSHVGAAPNYPSHPSAPPNGSPSRGGGAGSSGSAGGARGGGGGHR